MGNQFVRNHDGRHVYHRALWVSLSGLEVKWLLLYGIRAM